MGERVYVRLPLAAVAAWLVLGNCGRSTRTTLVDAATGIGEDGAGAGGAGGGGMGAGGLRVDAAIEASGGRVATGGFVAVGGTLGGGAIATGGTVPGAGGILRSGGAVASDAAAIVDTATDGTGQRTGGTISTGGVAGTGGVVSTGGVFGTGGVASTGGIGMPPVFPAKFVGNIDTRGAIRTDFSTFWDQFTPENAGKWASVQGSSASTFNWATLDAMYAYTEEHHIVFKEHTFLFGASLPGWMGALTTETGPAAVKAWMKTFCARYPKTRLIDVVNEPPPHTTPVFANAIGGGTNTTWTWIVNAFTWAREACPGAVLLMNDYQNLEYTSTVDHNIDILRIIQAAGAPIDAIGCETHNANKLPAATLKANIDKLVAATGLPIYITEYDIGVADDELQRQQYAEHFPLFMSHPSVKGVTVWGYIQGATWISNSGLMKDDGTKRPAMTWLMQFLNR